jgi:hypothetical protein
VLVGWGESHGEPRGATGGECAESIYECARLGGLSAGGGEEVGLGRGRRVVKKKKKKKTGQASAAALAQVSRPKRRQAGARGRRGQAQWAASR